MKKVYDFTDGNKMEVLIKVRLIGLAFYGHNKPTEYPEENCQIVRGS
jgi:hypothetical protein